MVEGGLTVALSSCLGVDIPSADPCPCPPPPRCHTHLPAPLQVIPGNETQVSGMLNSLALLGAHVVQGRGENLHTSGHAYQVGVQDGGGSAWVCHCCQSLLMTHPNSRCWLATGTCCWCIPHAGPPHWLLL